MRELRQSVFWALRQGHPAPAGATEARLHTDYAASIDRRGRGVVHHVDRAMILWRFGQPWEMAARWACSSFGTYRARAVTDPDPAALCAACVAARQPASPIADGQVVYAGIGMRGLLKVGTTTHLARRCKQLGLTDVVAVPGGFAEERDLLARLGQPAMGREYFRPDGNRVAQVRQWMAERAA